MFFYHMDSAHSLSEGMVLGTQRIRDKTGGQAINILANNLPLKGIYEVSHFGQCMIDQSATTYYQALTNTLVEDFFEFVRQLSFTNQPSRLQCLFAVKCVEDIKAWSGLLKREDPWVWRIECPMEKAMEHDARLLLGDLRRENLAMQFRLAESYWSGIMVEQSLPEILLPLPVRVLERICL